MLKGSQKYIIRNEKGKGCFCSLSLSSALEWLEAANISKFKSLGWKGKEFFLYEDDIYIDIEQTKEEYWNF